MKLAVNNNDRRIIVDQSVVDYFEETEKTKEYYESLIDKELEEDPNYDFLYYETIGRIQLTHYMYHHDIFDDFLAQLYHYHRNLVTEYIRSHSEEHQNKTLPEFFSIAVELANNDIIQYLEHAENEFQV